MAFPQDLSGLSLFKAGKTAATEFRGISGSAILISMLSGAAALFSNKARKDFVADYPTMPTNRREIVDDGVSSYVACQVVAYDMSNYTSRIEAEDVINVHRDNYLRCMALLQHKENTDFIENGTDA